MKLFITLLLSFSTFFVMDVMAQGKVKKVQNKNKAPIMAKTTQSSPLKRRGPASDPDAPIEVRGQSRNLNMLLILQNQDEVIDFIKLRKDYQHETKKMNY